MSKTRTFVSTVGNFGVCLFAKQLRFHLLATMLIASLSLGCAENLSNSEPFNSSLRTSRYLYVASGACYAGGVTVSTGSATISKYDTETGAFVESLIDYNLRSQGDMPAGLQQFDANRFLVGIENTSGRRIDIIDKDGAELTTYLTNSTALNGVLRGLSILSDSSLLVPKSTAIEKFSASRARVTQGANPFVNAPAGSCATSTTVLVATTVLPNGKIVFAHAGATPNNKIAVISATGYAAAGDCLSGQAAPTTTALPTAVAYHATSGKLIATFGSTTSSSNFIYTYDVNLTTGAISNPIAAYTDFSSINGPSSIAVDTLTGHIYVSNGASTFNNIEKFVLNSNGTMSKLGSLPFVQASIYSRCISGMVVSD